MMHVQVKMAKCCGANGKRSSCKLSKKFAGQEKKAKRPKTVECKDDLNLIVT